MIHVYVNIFILSFYFCKHTVTNIWGTSKQPKITTNYSSRSVANQEFWAIHWWGFKPTIYIVPISHEKKSSIFILLNNSNCRSLIPNRDKIHVLCNEEPGPGVSKYYRQTIYHLKALFTRDVTIQQFWVHDSI